MARAPSLFHNVLTMYAYVEKGAQLSGSARSKIQQLGSPQEVQSILILRHAAMGDMIHTRPFLVELRRCFPKARLILGLVSHYQYFAPTDLVDQVIITPGTDQRHLPLNQRWRALKSFPAVDLLIDLADTPRSLLISWLTKAKVKMGFPYRSRIYPYDIALYRSDMRFEAENLLEFLWFFGHAPLLPLNYGWDSNQWPQHDSDTTRPPQILCFFGVSDRRRAYPRADWKQLLLLLLTKHPDVSILVVKGQQPWEELEGLIAEIHQLQECRHLNPERLEQLPAMEMHQLARIMAQSRVFISNDTGPRHLAISLGVPCASFFHITCPGRNFPYSTVNAHQHQLLANQLGGHLDPVSAYGKIKNFI